MECRAIYDLGEKNIERQESVLCKVSKFLVYYRPFKFWIETAFVNFELTMDR